MGGCLLQKSMKNSVRNSIELVVLKGLTFCSYQSEERKLIAAVTFGF